jgi:mannan endo-1,4-beta-mannosidase
MNLNQLFKLFVVIFSLCFSDYLYSQYFTVSGTRLLDANGKEFVIRGVNNPHVWFPAKSNKALTTLAELKVNSVRVVWETKGKPHKLKKTVEKCIALNIIPIIELHDATGDTTTDKLMQMVAYFTSNKVKHVLIPHEKYLLINIANEWGSHLVTAEYWRDSYKKAVEALRSAGYKTTIVIDAPGWGQNLDPIILYGNELLQLDPLHNLLFSIHMYGSWNDPQKIDHELQRAFDDSIPLIVGEFGYNFDKGNNNLHCTVDHTVILRKCSELNYGYLAWSWTGNNKENAWLNLAEKRDWKTLTWWGRQVFESEYGINKTAKKCSVFTAMGSE